MGQETVDEAAGDDLVIALAPAQIGALLAMALAVVIIFRTIRRNA